MAGPRIISNIEALQAASAAGLPDLIIIGKKSNSNVPGLQYNPQSITIEKFMELVNSGSTILIDENDFVSNSNTQAPTQQSTKAYITDRLAAGGFTLLDNDSLSESSRTLAATQGSIKVYIDNSNTFTNPAGETNVRNNIGDVKHGVTNINGLTFQEIFEKMYFPYSLPTYNSFSILGISSTQEIGTVISQNRTFSWGYNNLNNIQTGNVLTINDVGAGSYLGLGLTFDKTITSKATSLTTTLTSNDPGNIKTFRISGVNTNAGTFSRDLSIGFYGRVIWGTFASETLGTADVPNLVNNQSDLTINMTNNNGNDIVGSSLTFTPSASQYSYLLIPAGVQLPVNIVSSSLSTIANSYDMYEGKSGQTNISLLTSTGITISYHVFRSENPTSAASTAIIKG
jgi:hypothetical protein